MKTVLVRVRRAKQKASSRKRKAREAMRGVSSVVSGLERFIRRHSKNV